MKKVIATLVLAIVAIAALTSGANAQEISIISKLGDPADIASRVMELGTIEIPCGDVSLDDIKSFRNVVHAYIDAVSVTSETPRLKTKIRNPDQPNAILILTLEKTSTENFSDTELDELLKQSGTGISEIDEFIQNKLDYDSESVDNEVISQNHSSAVAKSALKSGKAICQGYSNLFMAMANRAGYNVIKIRGHLDNGSHHVCNAIKHDNGIVVVIDVTSRSTGLGLNEYCKSLGFRPAIDVESAFNLK